MDVMVWAARRRPSPIGSSLIPPCAKVPAGRKCQYVPDCAKLGVCCEDFATNRGK